VKAAQISHMPMSAVTNEIATDSSVPSKSSEGARTNRKGMTVGDAAEAHGGPAGLH